MINFVPSYIVSCEEVNPIIETKWPVAEINPKASYDNPNK
jgi:hypothetical protein